VDDVVLGELRFERLGERRTELDRRQLIGPAAQRMTVMIDRGLVCPRLQELAGQYL